jgi:hypothetical protein
MNHLTGVAHLLSSLAGALIRTRAMDQAQFDGRRVGQHYITQSVEQHYPVV